MSEANTRTQYVTPETVADMIIKKDPSFQLIDVRSQDEFEKFSLPGAINIPVTDLLSDKYTDILNQDVKMNIFYSNGTITANEAWMVTRQLGYKNNFVLEGGLNYWFDAILNPQKPASTSPDEEFAKYDFRLKCRKGPWWRTDSANNSKPKFCIFKTCPATCSQKEKSRRRLLILLNLLNTFRFNF